MNQILSLLNQAASYVSPWLSEISTALIACLIVMFAVDINRVVRRLLTGRGFVIRTLVFVLINAFGYGLAIVAISPILASQLKLLPGYWMLTAIVVSFLILGFWAQKNRQV
ncbi:DUF3392 domain-containing protein [Shewanella gaetbuli]|uniref:DUF3392 domain-containing protein n=1 Tax=Shewanella gaetbuli TaxID=220752 RepID=A0A9X1ZU06_9GAMM|nr:DUF3392 domain-containing protein [Shewanella gaetbuli]MCL1144073.1 DUF3392 domain-containing protein [Shewanella gaetbuli]